LGNLVDKLKKDRIYLSLLIYDRESLKVVMNANGILPTAQIVDGDEYAGRRELKQGDDNFLWALKTCLDWDTQTPGKEYLLLLYHFS